LGIKLPTSDEERADPAAAGAAYADAVAQLRHRTRDTKEFRLLDQENRNYGFERNLLGIRPLGITVAAISGIVAAIGIVSSTAPGAPGRATALIVALTMSGLALVGWLTVPSAARVREAADRYATELLEASAALSTSHPNRATCGRV
jgi:hypothetical protein